MWKNKKLNVSTYNFEQKINIKPTSRKSRNYNENSNLKKYRKYINNLYLSSCHTKLLHIAENVYTLLKKIENLRSILKMYEYFFNIR